MAAPTKEQIETVLKELTTTDATKKTYRELYPALSPSRPEFSQAGRTVLITGGGTSVGLSIGQAFTQASAKTVIIIGRRSEVLESAKAHLLKVAEEAGSKTTVITRTCDVTDLAQLESLWKSLASEDIVVDVFVANAAAFPEPKPLLELGADTVWSSVETNAKAPLFFAEKFIHQLGDRKGYIVNVSSQIIHTMAHPMIATRPAYSMSKMFGTLVFQNIAMNTPVDRVQIVSFHPGLIYSGEWKAMGISPDMLDKDELCGAFAVWLATEQASFLQGRYVMASWDIEELSAPEGPLRKRMEKDAYFLRSSIVGLNTMLLA